MNLPQQFLNRMEAELGNDFLDFVSAIQDPASVSVRVNPAKLNGDFRLKTVPWCSQGHYLQHRPIFTLDPLLHSGCYYVQDASSMVLAQVMRQIEEYVPSSNKVLDLCAAPGGKTTLLADLLSDQSLIVANEVIRSRAKILAENLCKWSVSNVVVTNNDPADFSRLQEFFDIMLVDAPCSGEGIFRKQPESIDEWNMKQFEVCSQRQQRILRDALPSLKVGGFMIYSTCTFHPGENQEIVEWLESKGLCNVCRLDFPEEWGFREVEIGQGNGYYAYPHRVQGEGFFVALMQKTGSSKGPHQVSRKLPRGTTRKKYRCEPCQGDRSKQSQTEWESVTRKQQVDFKEWIHPPDSDFRYVQNRDEIFGINDMVYDDFQQLKQLKLLSAGVQIAEVKSHGLVPAHGLALSSYLNRESFPVHELDWEQALRYLRREPIQTSLPEGIGLVSYRGHSLGWVKQVKNRANNWYPQNWRVRLGLPENEPWTLIGEL